MNTNDPRFCSNCGKTDWWGIGGATDDQQCGYCGTHDERDGLREALTRMRLKADLQSGQIDQLMYQIRNLVEICDERLTEGHRSFCDTERIHHTQDRPEMCDCGYREILETVTEARSLLPHFPPQDCPTRCRGECSGCGGGG